MLLQTNSPTIPFTRRRFYAHTHTLAHKLTNPCHARTRSKGEAFTRNPFRTQALFHTGAFTHKRFYTQTL